MIKALYHRTVVLAESRHAPVALGLISFAESSFFPVPPDVLLVPMALARPDRAWFYAGICTITSVLGGLLGYAIGAVLYDTIGAWLISFYGYENGLAQFRQLYQDYGHWIILVKGLTPIPYKLVTIASGVAEYSLLWFVMLSTITRGARFFIVAGLLNRFGGPLRELIERHLVLLAIGTAAIIVAGFLIAKALA